MINGTKQEAKGKTPKSIQNIFEKGGGNRMEVIEIKIE